MAGQVVEFGLLGEESMQALACEMAITLHPGDVLLLEGPVGAGKTTFARALISRILLEPEDVPSPTFTLVQSYETQRGPLWHCDLYRLTSSHEIEELGLTEAFETAICLVEWPDLLGEMAPASALTLHFAPEDPCRRVTASFSDPKWKALAP